MQTNPAASNLGQTKKTKPQPAIEQKITSWIGSTQSLAVHTFLFAAAFVLGVFGVAWDSVLLVLTTLVSLEAIYLAIFIQIGVNRTNQSLKDVEEDIEDIQEDVEEIQEDVGEIQEDVEDLGEDVEEIQEDVSEIQEDLVEEDLDSSVKPVAQSLTAPSPELLSNLEKQLLALTEEIRKLKSKNS